ncbi:MAG: hypothetical protein SGPRY_011982, partial [Prymnesium sp.]
ATHHEHQSSSDRDPPTRACACCDGCVDVAVEPEVEPHVHKVRPEHSGDSTLPAASRLRSLLEQREEESERGEEEPEPPLSREQQLRVLAEERRSLEQRERALRAELHAIEGASSRASELEGSSPGESELVEINLLAVLAVVGIGWVLASKLFWAPTPDIFAPTSEEQAKQMLRRERSLESEATLKALYGK